MFLFVVICILLRLIQRFVIFGMSICFLKCLHLIRVWLISLLRFRRYLHSIFHRWFPWRYCFLLHLFDINWFVDLLCLVWKWRFSTLNSWGNWLWNLLLKIWSIMRLVGVLLCNSYSWRTDFQILFDWKVKFLFSSFCLLRRHEVLEIRNRTDFYHWSISI